MLTPLRVFWIAGAILFSFFAIGDFVDGAVTEGMKGLGAVFCCIVLAILVPHWGAILGRPAKRPHDDRDTPST